MTHRPDCGNPLIQNPVLISTQDHALFVAGPGLDALHDLAEIPFFRLLAGRELLKGLEELRGHRGARPHIADMLYPPVIIVV